MIGIGNPLRGDDAVGWRVAEAIEARWGDRVRVLGGHQVVPEWASDLATTDVAYFVDASVAPVPVRGRRGGCVTQSPSIQPLQPAPRADAASGSHGLDPSALLRITLDLYGRAPEAYLLTIPARAFGYGESLSPAAASGARLAVAALKTALAARLASVS